MPLLSRAASTRFRRNAWLGQKHPIWEEGVEEWVRNEKLIQGGRQVVLDELITFDWELATGPHLTGRHATAVYYNFPDRFADITTGHLFRDAPLPDVTLDFGGLGRVSREKKTDTPSPAELLYYNTDGIGSDGSQWNPYWASVARMAMATGHRWCFLEGPPEEPGTVAREMAGMRPYLTDFSPIDVTNWQYSHGRLDWAIIRRSVRKPTLDARGRFQGNKPSTEILLLVREDCTDLGATYAEGGWWTFDAEGNERDHVAGWEENDGNPVFAPLYYDRVRPQENSTRMSRSGIFEIGQAAVLDMNLQSAANWDLWDSASSVKALAGVDKEGFNLFNEMVRAGNRYAPLPTNEDTKLVPHVEDVSTGALVQQAFDARILANKDMVLTLMLNEIQISPDASGAARRVGWTDVRAPRLAKFASEIETTQNIMLHGAEGSWKRAGATVERSASVQWPRAFDLIDKLQAGGLFLEMERMAGVSSPTLKAKVLVGAAQSVGLLGDDDEEKTVLAEYEKSAEDAAKAQAQLGAVLGGSTNNPANPPRKSPASNQDGRRQVNRGARPAPTGIRK